MSLPRRISAWAVVCALWLVCPSVLAWTDARPSGLVTELSIDRDGGATVTLRMRWRVLAGRFRQFELVDLPTDLSLFEALATNASGVAVALSTRSPGPGRLEVSLGDEVGGVRRGAVDVVIRYTTSFRAQGAIQRAGADAVIEIATVPWERGLEAAEIRVALPTGARRAQWIADDTPGVDATTTNELSRDVVHALRRHLPAGTRWTARVAADASLFPWLSTGAPRNARVLYRARPRPLPAIGLALGLSLSLLGVGAWLSRATRLPLIPLSGYIPSALTVLGVCAQSLALLRIEHSLPLGTVLLLAAVALRVPRPRALDLASGSSAPRRVSESALCAAITRRSWRPWAATLSLLAAGALFAALGQRHHSLGAGIVALDLALLGLAVLALRHRTGAALDIEVLLPVVRSVQRVASRSLRGGAGRRGAWRVVWHARGDERATGSLRAGLVPRPGSRYGQGLRAVEWAVAMHSGSFGWRPSAVAIVRAETQSPLGRDLLHLSALAGTLTYSPDGGTIANSIELIGPDRSAFFAFLPGFLDRAFVPAA